MTSAETVLRSIGEARIGIDRAARRWSPTDLTRISECREALLESLRVLQELEPLLHQTIDSAFGAGVFVSASAAAAKIRAGLLALKNETASLERLVDSAAAFLRGALLLSGTPAPVYTAGGCLQPDVSGASSEGIQA